MIGRHRHLAAATGGVFAAAAVVLATAVIASPSHLASIRAAAAPPVPAQASLPHVRAGHVAGLLRWREPRIPRALRLRPHVVHRPGRAAAAGKRPTTRVRVVTRRRTTVRSSVSRTTWRHRRRTHTGGFTGFGTRTGSGETDR